MYFDSIVLLPLIIGFLLSFALTPLGIRVAKYFKLIDDPALHKHPAIIHTKPIPRAGGLPIFFSVAIGSLLLLGFSNIQLLIILFAGGLVVIVGLLDDKYDLSPYFRFVFNIISAALVVFAGVSIPFVTNPLGGILHFDQFRVALFGSEVFLSVSEVLAVAWIVWIMNMLNWSKGVDGQMPGVAAISAFIIGISSLRFGIVNDETTFSATLSFLVSGVSIGFLFYNFYPAKIFPGYSSTFLGFMIGILSILSGVKLATALLVMGVPAADALFTIIRRVVSKKSPFWHDKGHLHHLLLALGLDQRTIAVFYWTISLFLGIIALQLSSRGKLFAIISVIIIVSGVILTLKYFLKKGSLND